MKITSKVIEDCLTNIVKQSMYKIKKGVGTAHDKWVVENIKLN